jgi:RNA polymerase sigma-70 factor (ECF subfamily)
LVCVVICESSLRSVVLVAAGGFHAYDDCERQDVTGLAEIGVRRSHTRLSHSTDPTRHLNDGHGQPETESSAMTENDLLTVEFERNRARLRAVAYRMLGSISDADDAVQESWLRLSRSDPDAIANLPGWLTAVVARVSLDMLKARRARHEDYVGSWLPEPVVAADGETLPEEEALLADSVGLALLVVLDSLAPPERLAFVLHDMFAVPFGEIATIVGTTTGTARQLASRARRRVRGAAPVEDADLAQQRELVDAFLAASREGDFAGLVAVLDPNVVFRIDAGGRGPRAREPITGSEAVARQVLSRGRPFARFARPVLVNGRAGVVVAPGGTPMAVVGFTTAGRRIAAIDLITDREKLPQPPLGTQDD